jgi:hypothetical protein
MSPMALALATIWAGESPSMVITRLPVGWRSFYVRSFVLNQARDKSGRLILNQR